MRQIYLFAVTFLIVCSCTSEDEIQTQAETPKANANRYAAPPGAIRYIPNPQVIAAVIYNQGAANEWRFTFYPNGLLKDKIYGNSNVQAHFAYNSQQYLSSYTLNGTTSILSYDATNHLAGNNYDPIENKYVQYLTVPPGDEFDYPHKIDRYLNEEGLFSSQRNYTNLLDGSETSAVYGSAAYSDGNLTYYGTDNFHIETHFEHSDTANPLKAAFLPALRVLGLSEYYYDWMDGTYASAHNVSHHYYADEDPEEEYYTYTYNGLGLPVTQTKQYYYNGQPDGAPFLYAHYYYQGDVIP